MNSIVTLTTDFGIHDPYVGAVKGVLLSICPDLRIIDITHSVNSQAISEGAFLLGTVYHYFPPGTIHIVVVDPGVGSSRRPIAVQTARYRFIGPDNGVLTCALEREGGFEQCDRSSGMARLAADVCAVHLTRPQYWLPTPSATFHGRDIFAPTAAHLACGVPISELGDRIEEIVFEPVPSPVFHAPDQVMGQVIHVDRFGNLITNLRPADLPEEPTFEVAGREVHGLVSTYSAGQGLIALEGSSGNIEIAVRNGSAAALLGALPGQAIRVRSRSTAGNRPR